MCKFMDPFILRLECMQLLLVLKTSCIILVAIGNTSSASVSSQRTIVSWLLRRGALKHLFCAAQSHAVAADMDSGAGVRPSTKTKWCAVPRADALSHSPVGGVLDVSLPQSMMESSLAY